MPQKGYDTKTNRLTDCQSQCDFDFDFAIDTDLEKNFCHQSQIKYSQDCRKC
jgi:hypothetical protein